MRVINDKPSSKARFDLVAVAIQSIYTSLAMSTLFFSPLAAIMNAFRVHAPYSRLVMILGSLLAVTILQVPPSIAIIQFVISIFLMDRVIKNNALGSILISTSALSTVFIFFMFFIMAQLTGESLSTYWDATVSNLVEGFSASWSSITWMKEYLGDFDKFTDLLKYQGFFLFLVFILLSVWVSIALAAHMSVFPETHSLHAKQLRSFRLPSYFQMGYVVYFLTCLVLIERLPESMSHIFIGGLRVFSVTLFIQGSVLVSQAFSDLHLKSFVRLLFYSVLLVFGFYFVVGLGLIIPIYDRFLSGKVPSEGESS